MGFQFWTSEWVLSMMETSRTWNITLYVQIPCPGDHCLEYNHYFCPYILDFAVQGCPVVK